MFIPYQNILIPLIQFLQQVKLYGTIYGLITVHVLYGLPMSGLIFRRHSSTSVLVVSLCEDC
jgi:glucose/mannose transport system permease protein